jgi:hypothetical protein
MKHYTDSYIQKKLTEQSDMLSIISSMYDSVIKHYNDQEDAINRVLDLHREDVEGHCPACRKDVGYESYPCPTIKALDGEQSD